MLQRLQACHSLCVFIPYWLSRRPAQEPESLAGQWVKTEDLNCFQMQQSCSRDFIAEKKTGGSVRVIFR